MNIVVAVVLGVYGVLALLAGWRWILRRRQARLDEFMYQAVPDPSVAEVVKSGQVLGPNKPELHTTGSTQLLPSLVVDSTSCESTEAGAQGMMNGSGADETGKRSFVVRPSSRYYEIPGLGQETGEAQRQ